MPIHTITPGHVNGARSSIPQLIYRYRGRAAWHCMFVVRWKLHLLSLFLAQSKVNRYLCARSAYELAALSVCAAPVGCRLQGLFITISKMNACNYKAFGLIPFPYLTLQRYKIYMIYASIWASILQHKVLKIKALRLSCLTVLFTK